MNGALYDDDNGDDSGSAYVYKYNDGQGWTQVSKLKASDGADYDSFECTVSVSGDMIVVGADSDDDNGDSSGSAFVYHLTSEGTVSPSSSPVATSSPNLFV